MAECSHEKKYSKEHDSFYCPVCMEWLERKCKDPDCEFCAKRPERPKHG